LKTSISSQLLFLDGSVADFVLADDDEVASYKAKLAEKGGWLDDNAVTARLVYVNGRFCPQLSMTTESVYNMAPSDLEDEEVKKYLSRFTDGFTDELAVGVPSGPTDFLTSYSKLSFPDHCVGDPTSQFAINSQQGTACFAALNSVRTGAVAMIRSPKGMNKDNTESDVKPVLLVNAISRDMGCTAEKGRGAACHPRALVIAEEESRMSLVQSCVDLDQGDDRPKLYNGFTQVFVKQGADVSHSYLEETGGMVTGATELTDDQVPDDGSVPPRVMEASRPALKDTHLEAMDVLMIGEDAKYANTVMSVGGSGRVRIAMSVSLLRPGCFASVKGFSLSGGAQRTDMKTNIHHIAQATSSEQLQKSMVGGRATGAFRGRIRVEQSAQQTASNQLSRTILLSDRCRAWTAPTLEIIADDVQCTHGATVSDLSEEELFYLRSRGLDQATARNMLMYAFAGDISARIDPSMRGEVDSQSGVTHRVIQRLENLVPRGDRKIKGQFQSV
jgi:Fe-S cluster assembly scaffold protein SufB